MRAGESRKATESLLSPAFALARRGPIANTSFGMETSEANYTDHAHRAHSTHAGHEGDDLRTVFRAHGLRCTRQRELVYEALAATDAHPTADELYLAVRSSEPGLSLATVYNTLEAFTAAGLCRRIPSPTGGGACRYDADVAQHAHVVMPDGRVLDVPHDLGQAMLDGLSHELVAELEARLGVKIADIRVSLHAAPAARIADAQ